MSEKIPYRYWKGMKVYGTVGGSTPTPPVGYTKWGQIQGSIQDQKDLWSYLSLHEEELNNLVLWQKIVNNDIVNLSKIQMDHTKQIGDITQLTTTDKSSLVKAINEVNAKNPIGLKFLHKQAIHMSVKIPAYTYQLESFTSEVLLNSGLRDCVICHPFIHFNNPADEELKDLFYDIKAFDYDAGELYITITWNNRASHDMTKEYTLFFDVVGFGV